MTDEELKALGTKLEEYCNKYSIPIEYIFDILNEQKVSPMIRGKGTEYNVFELLESILNQSEWSVQKLTLGAQPGYPDEDISITHRRTGVILIAEAKNAVRDSMKSGARARIHRVPHFKVKCHRSRSKELSDGTRSDQYEDGEIDIIISNAENGIYQGGTIGPDLEVIQDEALLNILFNHYGVSSEEELIDATFRDWRFVEATKIVVDGFVPKTPFVLLENDPNWKPCDQVETVLFELVKTRRGTHRRR